MTAAGNGRRAPLGLRLHVRVRGIEQVAPAGPAGWGPLPIGEALHPWALAALATLVANDWVAKPALAGVRWASWATGKLSDVAGLALAPVALTAAIGVALALARALGAPVDPALRLRRLRSAVVVVGLGFVACKTSPRAADAVAQALAALGGRPRIVCDPSDLLALPALAAAWHIGCAELALAPRGVAHAFLGGAGSAAQRALLRLHLDEVRAQRHPMGRQDQARALERALLEDDRRAINAALRALAGEAVVEDDVGGVGGVSAPVGGFESAGA